VIVSATSICVLTAMTVGLVKQTKGLVATIRSFQTSVQPTVDVITAGLALAQERAAQLSESAQAARAEHVGADAGPSSPPVER